MIEWVLFFYDREQAQEVLPKDAVCQIVFCPIRHYTLEEQLRMPGIFAEKELDLLHIPHFNIPLMYPGKIVVTIHDLLWHEYRGTHVTTLPSWQYRLKHAAYRYTTGQAVNKAAAIFVPAETVKNTLVTYYPNGEEKVVVTKEGVVDQFFHDKILINKKREKSLVYVGSLYPHKNIEVVLQALPQLPEYQLHLIGARNVFQDQVRARVEELGVKQQVKFLGHLSDEELLKTIDSAHALIQPSLFEGFGLTGIEAMARQVPVIASDIPVFQEIYQDAALHFDPQSPEQFVQRVKELEDEKIVDSLVKKGVKLAKEYSWPKMAQQTLEQYLQVLHVT